MLDGGGDANLETMQCGGVVHLYDIERRHAISFDSEGAGKRSIRTR